MIIPRRSTERGHFDHGWLDTYHTFSFADYHDPAFMGYRDLRVINEDRVEPSQGFGTHGHRDMEIVTYIISGELEHKDSMGNGSVIRPGILQRMSAGTGIRHSEFNPSPKTPVHLLQIWLLPEQHGIKPGWEEKPFPIQERTNRLRLVASRDAREGSLKIHQDVDLYASVLDDGNEHAFALRPGRGAWIQVAQGALEVNGTRLEAGDGAAAEDERELKLMAKGRAEFLLFDLA